MSKKKDKKQEPEPVELTASIASTSGTISASEHCCCHHHHHHCQPHWPTYIWNGVTPPYWVSTGGTTNPYSTVTNVLY